MKQQQQQQQQHNKQTSQPNRLPDVKFKRKINGKKKVLIKLKFINKKSMKIMCVRKKVYKTKKQHKTTTTTQLNSGIEKRKKDRKRTHKHTHTHINTMYMKRNGDITSINLFENGCIK